MIRFNSAGSQKSKIKVTEAADVAKARGALVKFMPLVAHLGNYLTIDDKRLFTFTLIIMFNRQSAEQAVVVLECKCRTFSGNAVKELVTRKC